MISNNSIELSWSRKASEEAAAVLSLSCSGHGKANLDGLISDDGTPVCECNACYSGPDCSQFIADCVLGAEGGNPYFLEPFWRQNAENSAVTVPGWHRMGHEYDDGSLISKQLEKIIRNLHIVVGNAVTDGKYIVFGVGSTQLLNAAVHALSADDSSSTPTKVVAAAPYYPFKFDGDTTPWINNSSPSMNFIEIVTTPSNPDGQLTKAVIHGTNVKHIHDLAYYWPQYTAIPSALDEDLMIFTLSKVTGHAGSRFGWAIIKDKVIYERIVNYVEQTTYGVSRETQLRTLKLLNVVLEGNGRRLFEFGNDTMSFRWEILSTIFSASKRFSLQDRNAEICTFSKDARAPTPAYAWIRCENEEDEDCRTVLIGEANIIGRTGYDFGSKRRYVRLSLVSSQDDFDLLRLHLEGLLFLERRTNLISKGGDEI
ncbi:OLC1v1026757C1 [Oldenlandia corymbosa var. corymbosa]|uniref:OLC1v1026757C1 n=1 Tax=Oldenlandia corymbosa var. corymbosa TaxID=529605 RepID=A0AAV1CAK8_OLDCO|nr:OLC1v1026757C1 [Oldenlandia corymbosa var. corymbosa]